LSDSKFISIKFSSFDCFPPIYIYSGKRLSLKSSFDEDGTIIAAKELYSALIAFVSSSDVHETIVAWGLIYFTSSGG